LNYLFIQVMNNRDVGSILVVLAILLWYRQKWEVRQFLTSWKGMKWWLNCGYIWMGEMTEIALPKPPTTPETVVNNLFICVMLHEVVYRLGYKLLKWIIGKRLIRVCKSLNRCLWINGGKWLFLKAINFKIHLWLQKNKTK
jgi:hypothetical protein